MKTRKVQLKKYMQRFLSILFFIGNIFCLISTVHAEVADTAHYRISIITCGSGQDLYSVYGHSAVRVIDSSHNTDIVYNYGTFNFGDPEFYSKFTRGKLDYYLNDEWYTDFMRTYIEEGRSVYEQVLQINQRDASALNNFLVNNLKEENKYYKYDFLFDNCSTRIRNMFSNYFGKRFTYGRVIADDSVSFRTILNYDERNIHWERMGINLLLSHRVDDKMTNDQSMFLPDYLMKGLARATLDGQPLVKETLQLLPEPNTFPDQSNQPRMLFWALLLVIVFLSLSPTIKKFLLFFDVLFFLLLGLLGCFMLFMWFGTEHQVCAWNRNLLWAFPLHVVFAFMIARNTEKVKDYARYTSWLLVISMLYNLFADQQYISEITPILLLILFRLNHYSKVAGAFSLRKNMSL